jgi:hypothetical protein
VRSVFSPRAARIKSGSFDDGVDVDAAVSVAVAAPIEAACSTDDDDDLVVDVEVHAFAGMGRAIMSIETPETSSIIVQRAATMVKTFFAVVYPLTFELQVQVQAQGVVVESVELLNANHVMT